MDGLYFLTDINFLPSGIIRAIVFLCTERYTHFTIETLIFGAGFFNIFFCFLSCLLLRRTSCTILY